MENIGEPTGTSLQKLVDESGAVFDILTHLFSHKSEHIQLAALEVYVRRAYRAYSIQNISHDLSCRNYRIIEWRFLLPNSHPNMQVFAGFGKVRFFFGLAVCAGQFRRISFSQWSGLLHPLTRLCAFPLAPALLLRLCAREAWVRIFGFVCRSKFRSCAARSDTCLCVFARFLIRARARVVTRHKQYLSTLPCLSLGPKRVHTYA